jgi:hypothetical protein
MGFFYGDNMTNQEKNRASKAMIKSENRKIAKAVKDVQRERQRNHRGSSNSLKSIMSVKPFWTEGWSIKEIAKATDLAENTVRSICSALNKVHLRSPVLKELAVEAAKSILKSEDNTNRVKVIDKVFYDDRGSNINNEVKVNLNINKSLFEADNPEFDYVDMDTF